MLRAFFTNLIVVAMLSFLAIGIAGGANWHFQIRNLGIAAIIVAIVSEISLVPLLITRGKSQAIVSQAGLVGTVLHTMLCAGAGMAVASAFHTSQTLMYWLLMFYWATLISIALAGVRAVKTAPMHINQLATK